METHSWVVVVLTQFQLQRIYSLYYYIYRLLLSIVLQQVKRNVRQCHIHIASDAAVWHST